MRIIAGSRRGKRLKTLPGNHVRPTPDHVKEALFNILQFHIEGRVFLDLFAGSGQMGLEALSRGAERAVFVDSAAASCKIIRENIAFSELSDAAELVNSDFSSFLQRTAQRFDIAFLDPPYRTGTLEKALLQVADHMQPGGIIICEHPIDEEIPAQAGAFCRVKDYRYGKILLTTYRHKDLAEEG